MDEERVQLITAIPGIENSKPEDESGVTWQNPFLPAIYDSEKFGI